MFIKLSDVPGSIFTREKAWALHLAVPRLDCGPEIRFLGSNSGGSFVGKFFLGVIDKMNCVHHPFPTREFAPYPSLEG